MSEARLDRLEAVTDRHSQEIRGINAALSEITETMKAFANGIVELQRGQAQLMENQQTLAQNQRNFSENQRNFSENQRELAENQRNIMEAQRTMANTVERLAETVDRLAGTVANNAVRQAEEMATLTAAVERLDRIIDYLMRRDAERGN